ncbi:MAG: transposase, partial [Lacunisphaera sp.]|nr:transposase [Lacunisphaera sp.]
MPGRIIKNQTPCFSRIVTVLDEHTRECHVLRADRALKSTDVIALVKQAIAQHGAPEFIRSDNGSEF